MTLRAMTTAEWLDDMFAHGIHPEAREDVARDLMIGHLDGDDEAAVMRRAIEAHASYTGVTLPAWRF